MKAVTYDLWRTLVHDRDSRRTDTLRRDRLRALLGTDDDELSRILDDVRDHRHRAWSERRAPTVPELVEHALRQRGDPPPAELVERFVCALGEATRDAGVELLPGAAATVAGLAAGGVPVALICDVGVTSGAITRRVLADVGLLDHLAAVVLSDEIGVPKPYRAPFTAALAALGVPAGEAVHVGDLRRKDVAGARSAGLRSVRYRGDHDDTGEGPEAEFVIEEHPDLLPLLGR